MVSEDTAKWIPAAYEYYCKNADVFATPIKEEQLIKLLADQNPVVAIMAARRLAKSKPLAEKAIATVLTVPLISGGRWLCT